VGSQYSAAALAPSTGDVSARTRSFGAWLLERDIHVTESGRVASAVLTRESGGCERGPATADHRLPLSAMRQFGWIEARGTDTCCALVSPLGYVEMYGPPRHSSGRAGSVAVHAWSMHSAIRLGETHRLSLVATWILFVVAISTVGIQVRMLVHAVSTDRTVREVVDAVCNCGGLALLLLEMEMLRTTCSSDVHRLWRGRTPMPIGLFQNTMMSALPLFTQCTHSRCIECVGVHS
jgi:hypothetical protein